MIPSSRTKKHFRCEDYHVAWISPVSDIELLSARLMLDEELPKPHFDNHFDENSYVYGMIRDHAVVIASCPQGETGNVYAGRLTGPMFKTFPNIKMALLVGIGGGIPRATFFDDPLEDLHLGDVVVGYPGDSKPACVYYDRGRSKVNGEFQLLGTMEDPDPRLKNELTKLFSDKQLDKLDFDDQLAMLQQSKHRKKFAHPGYEHDRLFESTCHHIGDYYSKCEGCDKTKLIHRKPRSEADKHKLVFHQGRIATGTSVVQDGERRDRIRERCDGALCVEMEAAGVDSNRRCLIIRGIADYADSHKNDKWKHFAAGNAAAFARNLLCRIESTTVKEMVSVYEPQARRAISDVPIWLDDPGVEFTLAPERSIASQQISCRSDSSTSQKALEPFARIAKSHSPGMIDENVSSQARKFGKLALETDAGVQAQSNMERQHGNDHPESFQPSREFDMHPSMRHTIPVVRKNHGRDAGRISGAIIGQIPIIAYRCGMTLMERGTKTPDISKSQARGTSVADLKRVFNSPPDWGEETSLDTFTPFDLITVLHNYLNLLSTPLIREDTAQALGNLVNHEMMDRIHSATMMPSCVAQLKAMNRRNLFFVLFLLEVLSSFVKDNRWNGTTSVYLSRVFNSGLFGRPANDEDKVRDRRVLSFLIEHYDDLKNDLSLQNYLIENAFSQRFLGHLIEWGELDTTASLAKD